MRMIVTGGAGFIGSRLVRRAVELGHEVLNVDSLTYAASVSSVWDLEEMPNYRLEPADITDRAIMVRDQAVHDGA
ncbi:MAG: NAD-dependent epimerase/dehydratase family protein, partial [Pseudomonadota bacterium]